MGGIRSGRCGLALTTKLAILAAVVRRADASIRQLAQQLPEDDEIDDYLEEGYVFQVDDDDLFYRACADIDSFLFESRSVYELTGRFLRGFFREFLDEAVSEDRLREVIANQGAPTEWIDQLRDDRITFFHQTAPWIAAEVVSREPVRYELVVMKRNIEDLSDPDSFVAFARLREVWRGYQQALTILFPWLEERIREVEERDCA